MSTNDTFSNIHEQIVALARKEFRTLLQDRGLVEALKLPPDFSKTVHQLAQQAASEGRRLRPIVEQVALAHSRYLVLERIGWLPHETTPLHLLDGDGETDSEMCQAIEAYYIENWARVRDVLLSRVHALDLDPEAKLAFTEGVEAHGHGLFRANCRLLLVEIERLVRVEFAGGAPGYKMDWRGKQVPLADVLKQLAGEQPLPFGYLSMLLFVKLTDQLYASAHDEAAVRAVTSDPVPNRHAALHGVVPYRTMQNSLNVLFLTEYAFQIVAEAKADLTQS